MGQFFAWVGTKIAEIWAWAQANPWTAAFRVVTGISAYNQYKTAQDLKNQGREILLTKYGTGGGMPVCYGTRRLGGTVVFMDTAKEQRELFVVYAYCAGESQQITDLRIDGRPISDRSVYRDGYLLKSDKDNNLYGSGATHGSPSAEIANILGSVSSSNVDNPRMVFNLHHGSATQSADPMLTGIFNGTNSTTTLGSNHKLSGITYIAANYEFDNKGMFQGIPNLTTTIKGRTIYDPRLDSTQTGGSGSHRNNDSSTWEWSDNPALCLLDYLTNDEYGKGLAYSDIDISSFMDAADDCDTTGETITHGTNIAVVKASTSTDLIQLSSQNVYNQIKIGQNLQFSSGGTTYFNGKVVSKNFMTLGELGETYGRRFLIELEPGAVTTAITSTVTGTLTETQKRFECNAVIDTDRSVLENAKDLIANMRGIFTYTNGKYSIKVEGTETSVVTLNEDDMLEVGIELSIDNKESKFNRVECQFYNSSKNFEADTVVVDYEPASPNQADHTYDDGGESLETRAIFPFVTNQRIAYNHAKAILNRSRDQRSLSFVATPKALLAKVGEVITINNTNLGLSSELYRITNMVIQQDLNVRITAVKYQSNIYGYYDPPDDVVDNPGEPVDPYKVVKPTNLAYNQKNSTTGAPGYLSWTDSDEYPAYQFRVLIYDGTSQSGSVVRDALVQTNRLELPHLPKANGYSATVTAIASNLTESEAATLNSFNVTVDAVVGGDIADSSIDLDKIASDLQSAIDAGGTNSVNLIRSTSAPTQRDDGSSLQGQDIWIDTDDNNQVYIRNSANNAWVKARDASLVTLVGTSSFTGSTLTGAMATAQSDIITVTDDASANSTAITNLTSTVNTKARTFIQTSAPTATAVGDLWIDSDDDNKLYRWNGSAWVSVRDTSNPTIFTQASAPTANNVGDLWFDTDDNNKQYRWDGSSWVEVRDVTTQAALTTESSTRASADSAAASRLDSLEATVNDSSTGVSANASALSTLNAEVFPNGTAQASALDVLSATVDQKNQTFIQASAPTAEATGDLWIDSDDDNKLYRWNGTSWVEVRDTANDNKTTVFTQTTAPTANNVGDLWFDTDDNNKQYRWDGSSWVEVRDVSTQATVSTHSTAIADLEGNASASYVLQTDANGAVAQMILASNAEAGSNPTSIIAFRADSIQIDNNSGSAVSPFVVTNNQVFIDNARITNLSADKIQIDNLTLDTLNGQLIIKDDGVGVTQLADRAAGAFKVFTTGASTIGVSGDPGTGASYVEVISFGTDGGGNWTNQGSFQPSETGTGNEYSVFYSGTLQDPTQDFSGDDSAELLMQVFENNGVGNLVNKSFRVYGERGLGFSISATFTPNPGKTYQIRVFARERNGLTTGATVDNNYLCCFRITKGQ